MSLVIPLAQAASGAVASRQSDFIRGGRGSRRSARGVAFYNLALQVSVTSPVPWVEAFTSPPIFKRWELDYLWVGERQDRTAEACVG